MKLRRKRAALPMMAALLLSSMSLYGGVGSRKYLATDSQVLSGEKLSDVANPTNPLVVLDVSATTGRGKAITDLKAENFTLLEDGREQKISFLHLRSTASQAGTRNAIVVDPGTSMMEGRAAVRKQLIKFLKKMPMEDPVAIFQYTESGLQMLQDFTTDRTLLECRTEHWFEPLPKHAFLLNPCLSSSDIYSNKQPRDMEDLIAILAAYPGRKNLIWLAEWPFSYRLYDLSSWVLKDWPLVPGTFDLARSQNHAPSRDSALDSDFAVYLIEPQRCFPVEKPSQCCLNVGCTEYGDCPVSSSPGPANEAAMMDELEMSKFHRMMTDVSKRAGGRAYFSQINVGKAIGDSITRGSTYYVLGYYPGNANWDGTKRQIEIKVKRPKINLRYRRSYVASALN